MWRVLGYFTVHTKIDTGADCGGVCATLPALHYLFFCYYFLMFIRQADCFCENFDHVGRPESTKTFLFWIVGKADSSYAGGEPQPVVTLRHWSDEAFVGCVITELHTQACFRVLDKAQESWECGVNRKNPRVARLSKSKLKEQERFFFKPLQDFSFFPGIEVFWIWSLIKSGRRVKLAAKQSNEWVSPRRGIFLYNISTSRHRFGDTLSFFIFGKCTETEDSKYKTNICKWMWQKSKIPKYVILSVPYKG